MACHKLGKHDEALISIDKALLSKPNDSNYLFSKTLILESLGKLNESLTILLELEKTGEIEEAYNRINQSINSESSPQFLISKETILFDNYTKWMKENGAIFSKIGLKYFGPSYRGIVAIAPLEKDEIVLSVPKETIITLTMAKNTIIGKKLAAAKTSLIYPNNSTLATFVLLEKMNPHTKWKYMIEAMPESVSNFPIFFTAEEKKLLAGSQFLRILSKS